MYGNSGCVGGFAKPTTDATVDRSSRKNGSKRGVRGQGTPHKDWWTSSSAEMDNNVANSRSSQRSTSSIGGTSQNPENRVANNNANTGFVNHALLLWNERRREWVANRPQQQPQEPREPVISWTTTYDDLLATSRPFPQPIPLPEMVDFLVDVWEQEGLYD